MPVDTALSEAAGSRQGKLKTGRPRVFSCKMQLQRKHVQCFAGRASYYINIMKPA
jgi:hypothetical protein